MSSRKGSQPETSPKMGKLYRYLGLSFVGTYFLGAVFYADPFHFWEHALSELGTTVTLLGKNNLEASLMVTLGTFINGRLMVEIARLYRQNPSQSHGLLKSNLMYTASLGSFISIFPNNLFHTIHSIGSGLLIGSVFFFDLTLLWESVGTHKALVTAFLVGILSLSVLAYAVTYFLGLPIKQATQKICIINLVWIFLESSRLADLSTSQITAKHPS